MKILVIQQKMVGDVLTSSIICNNLKRIYPDAQVDYLVYPFTKAVVENNPNINNILLFDDQYRNNKKAFLAFLFSIRKYKYDVVIDAYGKLESNLIVAFSKARMKIGFHKSYTSFLYTKTIRELAKPITNAGLAIENRMNLLLPLHKGNIALDNKPHIFLTKQEINNGKQILEENNIDFSKKVIMIGVLGSTENKSYPEHYMAKVLDFIVEKTNATLIFNYMPSQKDEANRIFNLCNIKTQTLIKIDIVPKNIREFLSITYHCKALVGNEGGAVNMAKAMDVPTFTIFSPWIIKDAWNLFEDGTKNVSVHLNDFKPELYGGKSPKEMKKKALDLYDKFTPNLFLSILENYLKTNN